MSFRMRIKNESYIKNTALTKSHTPVPVTPVPVTPVPVNTDHSTISVIGADGRPLISINNNYVSKIDRKKKIKPVVTEQFIVGDDTIIYNKETGLWEIKSGD